MRDDTAAGRFEIDVEGQVVFARYRRGDGVLFIDHVEAPPRLRGTGAATRLMEAIVARAHADGERIVPLCGYAAAWLKRNGR